MTKIVGLGREFYTTVFPGVLACVTVAVAAMFLSDHYGGPTMLYALLLGIAFNFLSETDRTTTGIDIASKDILRIGVALLGLRISFDQIMALGWGPVLIAIAGIVATIVFGVLCVGLTRRGRDFGCLTGGAVAICGASAALAISSVLPRNKHSEENTIYTIVTVTALSTTAMVLYPMLAEWLGLNIADTGIFLGGTIHDVAQVVGAGYSVSDDAGDIATVIKLFRVAMLIPVVLIIAMMFRNKGEERQSRLPVPLFALVFAALVAVNNFDILPEQITVLAVEASRWCIVTAVAALGMKTSFKSLLQFGAAPFVLIVAETAFLAVLVLGGIALL